MKFFINFIHPKNEIQSGILNNVPQYIPLIKFPSSITFQSLLKSDDVYARLIAP